MPKNTGRRIVLLLGDIAVLYLALFATLAIRYGDGFYRAFSTSHRTPFTIVFALWIIVFYIAGLYDLRRVRNNFEYLKSLALTFVVNAGVSISFFYLIPVFEIAPRRNLFIFLVLAAALGLSWRRLFNALTASAEAPNKVLLIGNGGSATEISEMVSKSPHLGYEIVMRWDAHEMNPRVSNLGALIARHGINTIVVPRHFKKDEKLSKIFYELLASGIVVHDLPNFYEHIFRKVPVADLEESWFLENLTGLERFYDQLKRGAEAVFALALLAALSPLLLLIAAAVKTTSPGPVFIRQTRVGKNRKHFTLYKFRSMKALAADGSAETNGAVWSHDDDTRTTVFGKFTRTTHLDELPQLWNILRGDLSFAGPRPERPEFVAVLREKIPYYDIRHLIKPGITGWAQINYASETSLADTIEKLQYDIYYLKNRSPILDAAIILKTIKHFFVNNARNDKNR